MQVYGYRSWYRIDFAYGELYSDNGSEPALAYMVGRGTIAPAGQRMTVGKKTGRRRTKALIGSGTMALCCPIELARLPPQARRRNDKGRTLYDMQGNEINTEGMVGLQFWAAVDNWKQVSITTQAFVTNVPTMIISAGKLVGKSKLMFDTDAHMMAGKSRLTFSRRKGGFYLGVEIPDLRPKMRIAPFDEEVDDHHDDDATEHMRPFDQDAEVAMNGAERPPNDDDQADAIGEHARDEDQPVLAEAKLPPEPSDAERRKYDVTYTPYASWCLHCVRSCGRHKARRRVEHAETDEAFVSFDCVLIPERDGSQVRVKDRSRFSVWFCTIEGRRP